MFPSLIPRYVDENWYNGDEPVDEVAELLKLEANHEAEIRGAQSNNIEVHTPHIEPLDDEDGNDDDDDDELNEDDEEDDDDMDDGDDLADDFINDDLLG